MTVVKPARELVRNTTASVTSSGVLIRPIGLRDSIVLEEVRLLLLYRFQMPPLK